MEESEEEWANVPHDRTVPCPFGISEYLPLRERLVQQPEDVVEMVDQIADVLHVLHYEAQVLHRDVSYYNIMWKMKPDGKPQFILCDFDLAIRLEGGRPVGRTAEHHTGTREFMAIELLQDMARSPEHPTVTHQLYHDYESLYWVAVWSAMKTETPNSSDLEAKINAAIKEWEGSSDYHRIATAKGEMRTSAFPRTQGFQSGRLSRFYQDLTWEVFMAANKALVDAQTGGKWPSLATKQQEAHVAVMNKHINRAKIQEQVLKFNNWAEEIGEAEIVADEVMEEDSDSEEE